MADAALEDPRCLVTTEALVVDGANGVCRDARLGRDVPVRASVHLALALSIAVLARRASRPSHRRWTALALALVAALPGWHAVLALRADAPSRVAATAQEIRSLHDTLRAFATRHECARIRRDECVACQPVARLALAGLRCEHPASIDLHADAWRGCIERESTLVCGAAP